jgi:ankyrin repeat protein
MPALTRALLSNDARKGRMLLWAGVNPNETDDLGFKALHWAVALRAPWASGWIDMLLAAGADPSLADPNGRGPIHWAAIAGALSCKRLSAANPACLSARDISGSTPLEAALRWGPPQAAMALVRAGADARQARFDINSNGRSLRLGALAKAFERMHDDRSPVSKSRKWEHWIPVIEALPGAGSTPGDPCLVERVGPVATPFMDVTPSWEWLFKSFSGSALADDSQKMVRLAESMLKAGWNPCEAGFMNRSGLHQAVMMHAEEVAHVLVRAGANPAALDVLGKSPVDYARDAGLNDLARMLDAMAQKSAIADATAPAPRGAGSKRL